MKIIEYENSGFQFSSRYLCKRQFCFLFCFCLPKFGFNISLRSVHYDLWDITFLLFI